MKMKGRKALAFGIVDIQLVGLYIMTLLISPQILASVGVIIIIMIVGNAATFIGGVVADKWQKSKYYHVEMEGK